MVNQYHKKHNTDPHLLQMLKQGMATICNNDLPALQTSDYPEQLHHLLIA